jgi:hypothetical protein
VWDLNTRDERLEASAKECGVEKMSRNPEGPEVRVLDMNKEAGCLDVTRSEESSMLLGQRR